MASFYIMLSCSLQTWNSFVSQYIKRFENKISNETSPNTEDSVFMFDAIWTAVLALNKTKSQLNKRNLTFMNFTYEDEHDISSIIYEEALKLTFFGLTVSSYITMYVCNIKNS